ncbi:hypothetical protein C7212DRAFT_158712, partial [Tuber magnatum]
ATRTACSDFHKVEFLSTLTSIQAQAFKPITITSAFQKTDLIPYDPNIVLSHLLENCTNTTYNIQSATPPPNLYTVLSTLYTVQSLKRHACYLETADPVSPTFRTNLACYIEGSLLQLQIGTHALEELENTRVAEQARPTCQNHS